jgi:4-hydroxy-tetrahydrodipicolinate reductase
MGRRLVALGLADPDLTIVAALDHPEHSQIGADAGQLAGAGPAGIPLSSALAEPVDVLIDFSVPAATDPIMELCVQQKIPLVMATTGLDDGQKDRLHAAANTIPIVWAPNMSLAVNLTMKLAAAAAEALRGHPHGVDVEIIERHHRYKQDAPSGTALHFGELIAQQMGQTRHVHGRQGIVGERSREEIGYHALRVGDNPGEHTIVFGMLGETIELTVRATNRDCYALGALAAARFVANQPPGMYGMQHVLGL